MSKQNKNQKKLASFILYCVSNPEQRFWQALRNWNQIDNPKKNFILTGELDNKGDENWINVEDTFYEN